MGKGDTPRPQDKEKYDEGFERAFGKRPLKLWEDAPKYSDGDCSDGGATPEVQETPGGEADSETTGTVGSKDPYYNNICPKCGNETAPFESSYFEGKRMCDSCGWIGDQR